LGEQTVRYAVLMPSERREVGGKQSLTSDRFRPTNLGMMMRALASMAVLIVASAGWAAEQQPFTADMQRTIANLQANHIDANAPPDASFTVLLQRDVQGYLVANGLPSQGVEIEPLRKGATQSGASYPKYYIWIRAADKAGHHIAGAMRVAAIDRVRFDVTDFTPTATIRSNPASLASIYPALLIPAIRQHAEGE
jgi:hypothetical protein